MAGGLLSALIGPQLVKVTTDATVVPFVGTYVVVVSSTSSARRCSSRSTCRNRPRRAPTRPRAARGWSF
jgi:hypothetical protein